MDPRIAAFQKDAEKVIQFLHSEFSKLQTGRANAAFVEHLSVEAYGQAMQLKAVAGISIQDARTIVIQPWDPSILQSIEKAIQQSNLGVTPMSDGAVIRLNLPPMTEERREQLKKVVHTFAEEARISARQHRQRVHDQLKEEKNETLRKALNEQLQKEVDRANDRIDEARKKKEEELMKI